LKDRESRSDNGQIPFIEIPEQCGGWLTKQALSDAPAGLLALLNRYLGDARQRLSILLKGSRISNYVCVRISGNGKIVLNPNAAFPVGLHIQPFARWRRSHTRSPDNGLARDAFSAHDYSIRVNLINAVP
jgi:hypothetical protein